MARVGAPYHRSHSAPSTPNVKYKRLDEEGEPTPDFVRRPSRDPSAFLRAGTMKDLEKEASRGLREKTVMDAHALRSKSASMRKRTTMRAKTTET